MCLLMVCCVCGFGLFRVVLCSVVCVCARVVCLFDVWVLVLLRVGFLLLYYVLFVCVVCVWLLLFDCVLVLGFVS